MALAYPLQGQSSYMHNHGMDVTMISSDGREMKLLLQQENCPHIIVPMTRSITPFRDMKCIFQLIKIFKKYYYFRLEPVIRYGVTAINSGEVADRLWNAGIRASVYYGIH